MIKSYGVFAEFYDVLTANIDYKKRALYFDELIKRHDGKQGGLLLDLACGTGSLSEELDNLGYDIIAVDNSPEMLGIAMNKKIEHQKNIQYVCQDMRELDLFGNADITVCALDSLNHLKNFKDLCVVFRKVFMFTEPGGLFLFDINTELSIKRFWVSIHLFMTQMRFTAFGRIAVKTVRSILTWTFLCLRMTNI